MTYDPTRSAGFRTQAEEEAYRQSQAVPTHATTPRVEAPAYGWTDGYANRRLSSNGGSFSTGDYLGGRYGQPLYDPGVVTAAQARGHTKDTVSEVGKFALSVAPERTVAPYDPSNDPPPRQIGDFEGMFGGLTRLATGFLPKDVQDTLAKLPEALGTLLDLPFGALRHDLPGFGVQESFEKMASTPDKEAARRKIAANPTWGHWYMTEYINSHMGDFSDAHGIPHALGMLTAPGASPIGRLFGAMNVPYEAATRTIAGGALDWLPGVEMDRATELLGTPDEDLHPLLLQLKQQYQRGDFDEDGLLDRLTTQGFGLTNDHFHGLLLSFITDPLILASFGTGTFARMTSAGGLAARSARVLAAVHKLPEGSPLRIAMADSRIQAATKKTSFGRYANRDLSYRATEHFIEQRKTNPAIQTLVSEAEAKLSPLHRAQVAIESVAKPANAISEVINSPFGIFGQNGAARAVLSKFTADTGDGLLRGHDYSTAVQLIGGDISNPGAASEALGHYQAQAQRGLVIEALHKQLRVEGKGEGPTNLPDSLNIEEYVKAYDQMDNPLSAREMESFIRATRRTYVPEPDPMRTPAEHQRFLETYAKGMNEQAALKLAHAVQIPIEEARRRVGRGGDNVWSFVDGLHWGRFSKEWGDIRGTDLEAAGIRMDAVVNKRSAVYVTEQNKVRDVKRATPVGPRELADIRAKSVLRLVKKALKSNDRTDVERALSAVGQYDQLRNNFFTQTSARDELTMLRWMERYLEEGLKEETFVKVVTDRTQLEAPGLWQLLDDANARMGGNEPAYLMGIGPTPDKAFRPVHDEQGHLIGYRAWLDVAADSSPTALPTKFDDLRFRLLTPIRAEHILQENRRRFIQIGAERFGLREADTTALWSELRKAGLRSGRTLRSFKGEELDAIVAAAAISDELKTSLGDRGLARLTAQAMEGDIRMVGVIPKMTGKLKSGAAGKANNSLGHVSEYIYPYVRFNVSPFFALQEYIEPFFFNILRGVKVGFRESSEDSAFRQMVFSIGGDELMAQDAMSREMRTIGVYASREAVNPNTQIGREVRGIIGRLTSRTGIAGVASTKWINHTNLTMERLGVIGRQMINDMEEAAHRAGSDEFDGAWMKIAGEMQRMVDEGQIKYKDPKTGQMKTMKSRQLSDGEIVRLYMEQSGISQRGRSWQTQLWDGQNPSNLGRVSAIRQASLAQLFGRDSGAALRADIANRVIDQWEFRGRLSRLGFDSDYTRRAWDMMTGPSVDDFLDSVERSFRQAGRTPEQAKLSRDLMDAHLQIYAAHHGLDIEEAVARKFNKSAQYLNANQSLPSNAYPQSVARNVSDHGWELADEFEAERTIEAADELARAEQVAADLRYEGDRARVMDELDSRLARRREYRQDPELYRSVFGVEPPTGPMADIEDIDIRIATIEETERAFDYGGTGAIGERAARKLARLRADREILTASPDEPLRLSSQGRWADADLVAPERAPKFDNYDELVAEIESRNVIDDTTHSIVVQDDGTERHLFTLTNADGKVVNVTELTTSPNSKVARDIQTVTKEGERRQGHATRVYREIEEAGYDLSGSGRFVTAEGEAFVQSRQPRAVSGEVITGDELVVSSDDWRRQTLDDLDEPTIVAVMGFDRDLARLIATVIKDPTDAAQIFDLVRNDPELGMSLVSHLATSGGDLQAMLKRFSSDPPTDAHRRIAADMNMGEGFMGKKDWTARDVQNLDRVRARRTEGLDDVDELDFADGVSIETQLPLHTMDLDVAQAVSAEVAPLVAEAVGRRTGARIVGIEDSMEGDMDAGALVSRGTRFVVRADSPGAITDAADEIAVLTGRETYVIEDAGRTVIGFDPTYGDEVTHMSRAVNELDAEGLADELDEIILAADEALMDIDEEAWSANRARYEHSSKFEPDVYRYQRGARGRGWRGATTFDRRRRATLYINDNADATTIVHETFHTWARDLDRSGKAALVDAYTASPKYRRMAVARRPTGAKLQRMAEEWAAEQFEAYAASGLAPDPKLRLHNIFNAYADWGRRSGVVSNTRVAALDPKLQALFDKMTPEVHGKEMAVFDPQQFRIMETLRVAIMRAEDESHTTQYFRRNKTFLERSVNHPFFGLYPVSYMYGKVLPEMARFLFKKPFGVNAPLAGAAMWNHVFDAMMLEMSGDTEFAQLLTDNPEAVRFFTLLLPGLPNDISVNFPAWMRRVATNSLTDEPTDFGGLMTDYLSYAMSDRLSPEAIMDGLSESSRVVGGMLDVFGGQGYESEAELKNQESLTEQSQGMYGRYAPEPYSEAVQ